MTMINTHDAFADGLDLYEGARCIFMGDGATLLRQADETRCRDGEVFIQESVMRTSLEAEAAKHLYPDGLEVDGVSLSFFGDGIIMFNAWNEELKSYSDVVITADDVRNVLAVLDGRTVH